MLSQIRRTATGLFIHWALRSGFMPIINETAATGIGALLAVLAGVLQVTDDRNRLPLDRLTAAGRSG